MWFRQILDFRVKDLKFAIFVNCFIKFVQFWSKIEILWSRVNDLKFWFSLGLRISNFINLPNSKFHQKIKFYPKKILNITNLVGSRLLCLAAGLATSTAAFRYDTIASKNIYDFQNDQNSFHKQSILFSASRVSYKILVMRANFVKFWWILQILVHIDFKILERILWRLLPHTGTNFEKIWIANFDEISKLW